MPVKPYTKRQRKERIEGLRRLQVLKRIRRIGMIKTTSTKQLVTRTTVGYVLGRYNSKTYEYHYCNGGLLWENNLKNITYAPSKPKVLNDIPLAKGYKYSISKVFVTIIYNKDTPHVSYTLSINLTKPNHYEMLSAVVTNI